MVATGAERRRNKYADISVILSFLSLLSYYVYLVSHARLLRVTLSRVVHSEQPAEQTWLSWPMVGSVRFASMALAVVALALSIYSLKNHPRKFYPLLFALLAFAITILVFV